MVDATRSGNYAYRSGVAKKNLKSAFPLAKNTDFEGYFRRRLWYSIRGTVSLRETTLIRTFSILFPPIFFSFGALNSFVAFWYVLEGVRKVAKRSDLIPSTSMHDDGLIIGLKVKSSN
jgi:hypothetical protein